MRSTDEPNSKSGLDASPVESSIESPAMPVAAARTDVPRDSVGLDREPAFEIGVDRDVHACQRLPQVRERLSSVTRVSGSAHGPREAGARRGERLETELDEDASAAKVPRVRDDETSVLVHAAEHAPPLGDAAAVRTVVGHRFSRLPCVAAPHRATLSWGQGLSGEYRTIPHRLASSPPRMFLHADLTRDPLPSANLILSRDSTDHQ